MALQSSEIRTLQLEFWDYSNRRLGVLALKVLDKYMGRWNNRMSNLENQTLLENYYDQFLEDAYPPKIAQYLAQKKLEDISSYSDEERYSDG